MQFGNVIRVRSISTVHYTGALAHGGVPALENWLPRDDNNGAPNTNPVVPEAIAAGRHCRSRLREIRIWSVQKIKWGVQLWASASGVGGTVIDSETYLGEWVFGDTGSPGDGDRATTDTFYYYYVNGEDLAIEDYDRSGQLHVRLVNWDSADDKLAGATGGIVIELALEPLQGR